MSAKPEAAARQQIDRQLTEAGWIVQDRAAANLSAGPGVAVREFPLKGGPVDYLLYVDGAAAGVVEAKKEGWTLSGVEHQSKRYSEGLPDALPAYRRPLPFLYEQLGSRRGSRTGSIPSRAAARCLPSTAPRRSRVAPAGRIRAEPGALPGVAEPPAPYVEGDTLRARLKTLPPLITGDLWPAQITAIENLEQSLALNRPRALIQMATGRGKTFTAVNITYRLIKFARAKRVLFLVDRGNLGRQTLKEFQQYVDPRRRPQVHRAVQRPAPQLEQLDPVARVCITHHPAALLDAPGRGRARPEASRRGRGSTAARHVLTEPLPVAYNPAIPIETFDVIFTDECHRSIYNLWRQVLEYFDAYLVGLTATPVEADLRLLQPEPGDGVRPRAGRGRRRQRRLRRLPDPHARSPSGARRSRRALVVDKRDRQTRQLRWEQLDDDLTYDAGPARPRRGRRGPDPHRHPDLPRQALHRDLPRPHARCPRR